MKQLVVGTILLVLVALGWGESSFGQERPVPRGELRIVDKSPMGTVHPTIIAGAGRKSVECGKSFS